MSEVASLGFAAVAAFCRVGGCFMFLPGFAGGRVPATVRVMAVLGLVAALVPMLPIDLAPPADGFALLRLVAGETLAGAFFGLAARLHMLALGFAAQAVATAVGFAAIPGIGVEDNEPSAPLATLVSFGALVLLLQMDFHHHVLRALVLSYDLVPPMAPWRTGGLLNDLLATLAASFEIALRVAAPFLAYALVANVAVGVVNRLAPQIPVYFVSLPFLIAGGLALFYLFAPIMLRVFADSMLALPALR